MLSYRFCPSLVFILSVVVGPVLLADYDHQFPRVVESKQTLSEPERLAPITTSEITRILSDWKAVKPENFYYENLEKDFFPFQEGRLTFRDASSAKWRYYHCAGFRLELSSGKIFFFLPKETSSQ